MKNKMITYIYFVTFQVISGVTEFPVNVSTSFERIRVVDAVEHPDFNYQSREYDFALLHLKVESNAAVISLDDGSYIEDETGVFRAIVSSII